MTDKHTTPPLRGNSSPPPKSPKQKVNGAAKSASDLASVKSGKVKPAALKLVDLTTVRARLDENEYFRVLGYNALDGTQQYVFHSLLTHNLIVLRPTAIRKENVAMLCPDGFLMSIWPEAESKAQRIDAFREAVISLAHQKGFYCFERTRGVGAWHETDNEDRIVINLGDRLWHQNKVYGIEEFKTHYHYQGRRRIEVDLDNPLTAKEGYRLCEICRDLAWENPLHGALLAGWIALAPIGGALPWRPHIWLNAAAGVGKTWVLTHIVQPSVNSTALQVLGSTTAAGIRQHLQSDARPVVYDEAESTGSDDDVRRIQQILGLMRLSSSSDSDAVELKGSATGDAQIYRVRSMFLLSSVAVGAVHESDESRISVLSLKSLPSELFTRLNDKVSALITSGFSERLFARMMQQVPNVLKNQPIFSKIAGERLGSSRYGDQIGTLLAGVWALSNDNVVSERCARALVERMDLDEENAKAKDPECQKALRHLMTWIIRIETEGERPGIRNTSIENLIAVALGYYHEGDLTPAAAHAALKMHGLKLDTTESPPALLISNTHPMLGERLKGTHWAVNWKDIFKNLPGSQKVRQAVRFGPGSSTWAVKVPLADFDPG